MVAAQNGLISEYEKYIIISMTGHCLGKYLPQCKTEHYVVRIMENYFNRIFYLICVDPESPRHEQCKHMS